MNLNDPKTNSTNNNNNNNAHLKKNADYNEIEFTIEASSAAGHYTGSVSDYWTKFANSMNEYFGGPISVNKKIYIVCVVCVFPFFFATGGEGFLVFPRLFFFFFALYTASLFSRGRARRGRRGRSFFFSLLFICLEN